MSKRFLMLSIHPVYAQKIFAGEKVVELRKIRPRVVPGDYILVYVSSPVKSLQGVLTVKKVVAQPINELWDTVKDDAGLSPEDFFAYYKNHQIGYGIYFSVSDVFQEPISLRRIRHLISGFYPPQSYRYFSQDEIEQYGMRLGYAGI